MAIRESVLCVLCAALLQDGIHQHPYRNALKKIIMMVEFLEKLDILYKLYIKHVYVQHSITLFAIAEARALSRGRFITRDRNELGTCRARNVI